MGFYETLDQVLDLLRRRGRVTYRALQREFNLDDAFLADLKDELLYAQHPVVEEEGRGLVWTADAASAAARTTAPAPTPEVPATDQERAPLSYTPPHLAEKSLPPVVPWKANASRSRCCSATWPILPPWPHVWDQKTCIPC